MVTEWAEKTNIDLSKIHNFDSFIQEIGKKKIQFSEQEIGKATINVPTMIKDEVKIFTNSQKIQGR